MDYCLLIKALSPQPSAYGSWHMSKPKPGIILCYKVGNFVKKVTFV